MPAWPARPFTSIVAERAATAGQDGEAAGLRHDGCVGAHRSCRDETARAGRLLLAHRIDDQIAAKPQAELPECLGGKHHRGDSALHVAGAATVHGTVSHFATERIGAPGVAAQS